MNIAFWKMHGAGNDFILLDAFQQTEPPDTAHMAAWCRRHTGIGADGVILLCRPCGDAHLRMRYFNADGREAAMCGNGARCAARLAHDLELAPARMILDTPAGRLRAEVLADSGTVRLELPPPTRVRLDDVLCFDDPAEPLHYAFADTGVPHAVIECDDVDQVPLAVLGPRIRHHPAFGPAGTNVNFMTVTGPGQLRIRTFERGVEDETPACGTGALAASVTAVLRGHVISPVRIGTAGGDELSVAVDVRGGAPVRLSLTGPAVYVFTGRMASVGRKDFA